MLVFLCGACTSPAESTGISDVSCPREEGLTYEIFGEAFVSDNSTQAQVKVKITRILDEAVYTTAMPEDATIEERALLGEWLACGAP